MGTTRSSRWKYRYLWKFGPMYQNRSTKRMKINQTASHARVRGLRLKDRESRKIKGTAKWNITSARPTACQPEYSRRVKNVISDGRLPAQIISNCEKLK